MAWRMYALHRVSSSCNCIRRHTIYGLVNDWHITIGFDTVLSNFSLNNYLRRGING